nr:Spindle pole body protein [Ipomoea batatas]
MLDGILGRGFSSKCKSLIKAIRSRIELVRRRAEARQRFLKEDLAKLLGNGLDINAYGRTEEFMAGQGLLSCYGFIDLSCEYILKQLPNMQKQSFCPEECREAAASLMFAAARFSDLPELRDLRDLIRERYGSEIECFVNQKFVEQLASRTTAMEKRIQLLQDIASEFQIRWDSAGFQQRMASAEGKLNKIGPSHSSADNYNLGSQKDSVSKTNVQNVLSKGKPETYNDKQIRIQGIGNDKLDDHLFGRKENANEHKLIANKEGSYLTTEKNDFVVNKMEELTVGRDRAKKERSDNSQRTSKSGNSSRIRGKDGVYSGHEEQERKICNPHDIPKVKSFGVLSHGQLVASNFTGLTTGDDVSSTSDPISEKKKVISTGESQEDKGNSLKSYNSYARPPPYVKPKDKTIPPPYVKVGDTKGKTSRGSDHFVSEFNRHFTGPSHGKVDAASSSEDIRRESDQPDQNVENFEPTGKNSHRQEREFSYADGIPLPKPRSVRRKHHKSSRNNDDAGNSEDARVVNRSNRRREHSKTGLQVLVDDRHHRRDDEERMIDKLLMHYSKKSSNYDIEKLRKKPETHGSHPRGSDTDKSSHERIRKDECEINSDVPPPPTRSISLPHEQATPSETKKVYMRANSFQPDNQARHVHPKLPDYEDLAAQFAALRGI